MKKGILFFVVIILVASFFVLNKKSDALKEYVETTISHTLVSHAGGAIYGFRYTNSLEALEESYKNGFKLIELDFQWTSDNKPVLIHDWLSSTERLFMIDARVLSHSEFKSLDTFQGLTLMDLDDLANWLRSKEDVSIVTDVKTGNLEFLKLVAEKYKDIQEQIVPQIYSFEEYLPAKELGYNNIILTLYKSEYEDDEVLEFAKENQVYAITMPLDRGRSELPMLLKENNINSYVHTINDFYIFEELYDNGATGIYTDFFHANKFDY